MSETERYHRQYKALHKIMRDLSEAGVTCHYRNRAVTDGTPASPFSVFIRWSNASNGETFGELNVHVDGKTYLTFGGAGRPEAGFEEIKAKYGTVAKVSSKVSSFADFAERLNPANLGYSPRMTAIVGAIIGHDYGVRDSRGGLLTGLSITSDGFVTAYSTASDGGGAFLGTADDLDRNLADYRFTLAGENDEDAEEFDRLYKLNVHDWRK
jgi:hypothetical protein